MSTVTAAPPIAPPGPALRALGTAAILVVAVAASAAVALLNSVWFDVWNGVLKLTDTVPRGLLFSSWLVVLGGIVVVPRPRAFGFRFGSLRRHLSVVTVTIAVATAGTIGLLRLIGSTPYSDASLFIETVDVPITEELFFRAVLLTALVVVLGRLWALRTATVLAIAIDSVAFGVGHLANLTTEMSAFTIGQAVFAAVLGGLCAALMVRTRSVYPAMALHAAVNAAVVLAS